MNWGGVFGNGDGLASCVEECTSTPSGFILLKTTYGRTSKVIWYHKLS